MDYLLQVCLHTIQIHYPRCRSLAFVLYEPVLAKAHLQAQCDFLEDTMLDGAQAELKSKVNEACEARN